MEVVGGVEIKSAKRLTPLQLNAFRFDVKHTVLTPELLERMAAREIKTRETKIVINVRSRSSSA